ncbi:MAG: hypothetical protein ACO1SV_26890 [Fimbriimonas sp.]
MSSLALGVPALLTLGFVMRPQPAANPYVFPFDYELDRRMDAYLPVVKLTEPHILQSGKVDEREATRLAEAWIAAAESGELKPLHLESLSESINDGAQGQIMAAQRAVANTLMVRGERRIRAGEFRTGAEDLIAAAKVYRPTQYSDVESATLTALQLRRALTSLRVAAEAMGPEERRWLIDAAQNFRSDVHQFGELVVTMRRLYGEDQVRQGISVPNDGLVKLSALRRATPGNETVALREVREQIIDAGKVVTLRPLVAALRRAVTNEIASQEKLAELTQLGATN